MRRVVVGLALLALGGCEFFAGRVVGPPVCLEWYEYHPPVTDVAGDTVMTVEVRSCKRYAPQ